MEDDNFIPALWKTKVISDIKMSQEHVEKIREQESNFIQSLGLIEKMLYKFKLFRKSIRARHKPEQHKQGETIKFL